MSREAMSRDEAVSEHDLGDAWREFQYTIVNNEITAESFVAFKRSIKRLALKSQLHEREAQRKRDAEIAVGWYDKSNCNQSDSIITACQEIAKAIEKGGQNG